MSPRSGPFRSEPAALLGERPRPSPLLHSLFAEGVVAHELRGAGNEADLHPLEARCLTKAVPKRRREFAAGRLCARESLAALGIWGFPLVSGEDRVPIWPASVVGSITHTDGFCGAAVADCTKIRSIGIDAELCARVEPELWKRICTSDELRWLQSLPPERGLEMAALIFSAKEAFYKCQYGLTKQRLGFEDARIEVDGERFAVHMRRSVAGLEDMEQPLLGCFRIEAGRVFTGIAFTAR